MLIAAIGFAVANKLGDAGYDLCGLILMIASIGYAIVVVWQGLSRFGLAIWLALLSLQLSLIGLRN